MKLRSEECREALRNYKVKNDYEKTAIDMLLTISLSDEPIKPSQLADLEGVKLFRTLVSVGQIAKRIGIENPKDTKEELK